MKKATLIYNPMAGRHPARREREIRHAATVLREAQIEAQLARTTGPGTAREMAQAAVNASAGLIVVCGGDGTINEVINGMIPSKIPLGILPGGTANILARELGLPQDPVRAARELFRWSPRRIAVGQATWPASPGSLSGGVRRRHFLSVAGIGFDAYVVNKLTFGSKMSLGVFAYVFEAVRQSLRYSFPSFTCQVDGQDFRAPFAVVQRASRYAGWLRLAPGASLFEPRFQVCLFKARSWARYLVYAAAVLIRRHTRLEDVELIETTRITCPAPEAPKPIQVELDGEAAGHLPVTFEILLDALTLLVP